MAWTMKTSVKGSRDSDSLAAGESVDAAGGRVRVTVEIETAFVVMVDIATDMNAQDVWIEVHLSNGGEPGADGGS